jgi:hypothetical protein
MFLIIGPEYGISEVGIMPLGCLNGVYKTGMLATLKNKQRLRIDHYWKLNGYAMPTSVSTHPLLQN